MFSIKQVMRLKPFMALRFASSQSSPKTGIVMLNMGGPQSSENVHDYLLGIMTDKDMIQFPFFQNKLGPWIAKRRTPEVKQKYDEIGGGSPIFKWTEKQGQLLCKQLDEQCPESAPHKNYTAFRYVTPFTDEAFNEVLKDGVKRIVVFSQYPQYSCATSGSSFNAIYRHFRKIGFPKDIKLSVIDRWSTNPLLAKTFADLIRKELKQLPEDKQKEAIILFSAHSIPLKTVNRGDSYPSEVGATVQMVMQELNYCNPYQLVWQSKVGPLPWLGPFTDDALKGYVKQGKKTFLLVPIAFVNEHIETLHEMDIEYCKDLAGEIGVKHIRRVPTPNDHPLFIDALTGIVKDHLKNGGGVSHKFLNRCPHCTNVNCYNSKKWYADICNRT
ncbi:PREDICTED: ferrochelatase, mitochondrial [Nicrophorus vespilloides]|uniref:Ferrochelatase n=1 Tax=Nicrophorus vespilloides TaxID=110193 RepID=A0ABM1MBA8_NICVS|nr:PREDICTED: ferrochelatase, mitochondrial [Nicrophorus vespilloides]